MEGTRWTLFSHFCDRPKGRGSVLTLHSLCLSQFGHFLVPPKRGRLYGGHTLDTFLTFLRQTQGTGVGLDTPYIMSVAVWSLFGTPEAWSPLWRAHAGHFSHIFATDPSDGGRS